MLATAFAHISSLLAGWAASWLVGLTFGLLNIGIAMLTTLAGTSILLKVGATPEHVEMFTAKVANGMQFVTGFVEGVAKIVLSLVIFSLFERQPGLVMLALFVIFQVIPTPSFLPESQRQNMRSGAIGTIFGLLLAWWLYYPA